MTGFPKQPGHFVSTDDGREAAWGDCHPTAPATPARRFGAPALAAIIVALVAWDIHVLRTNGDPSAALLGRGISRVALGQAGSQSRGEPEFDLSNVTVPAKEIRGGGPPKDGIPAIATPKLIAAAAAPLRPDDRVVGIVSGDDARAYPLNILNYHEIVNDRIGDTPVAVTYCPLCDSVVAFDRRTPLGEREFGVSGLLYNSNVLMYDRGGRPESLRVEAADDGVQWMYSLWFAWHAFRPGTTIFE